MSAGPGSAIRVFARTQTACPDLHQERKTTNTYSRSREPKIRKPNIRNRSAELDSLLGGCLRAVELEYLLTRHGWEAVHNWNVRLGVIERDEITRYTCASCLTELLREELRACCMHIRVQWAGLWYVYGQLELRV